MIEILQSTTFNLVASAVALAVVTSLAYSHLGFVGIALVGLFLGFVAVRVDLEKGRSAGVVALSEMSRAEKDARRAEMAGSAGVIRLAKALGFGLTLIGGLGFFTLQLPH